MKEKTPVQRAIDEVGGGAALAFALAVTATTVSEWLTGKRPIPLARALDIERLTNGKVTCESLRPDVNWQRPTHAPIRAGRRALKSQKAAA